MCIFQAIPSLKDKRRYSALLWVWSNTGTGFLGDASCSSVFNRHLATALSNMLYLLVSHEQVRQLDLISEGPFQTEQFYFLESQFY